MQVAYAFFSCGVPRKFAGERSAGYAVAQNTSANSMCGSRSVAENPRGSVAFLVANPLRI